MSDRRYGDGEVRKILELATRPEAARPARPGPEGGLTLPEIQSIALEVGVQPDAVARAAAALDAAGAKPRTSLGMPIEVGRTTSLPRGLTDAEWDRLVAELRATFRARGQVAVQGSLREWSNGNLHASIEPTDTGYRLRLGTFKSSAAGLNVLGATGVGAGAVVFAASALAGGAPDLAGPLVLALSGAAAFLANLVHLPRWAGERRRQMAAIEAKVLRMVTESAADEDT